MASSAPVIEVANLSKSYGDVQAVRDISFTINPGESVAILGPNGAGKTTTIEILEGYRTKSGGSVRVLGIDPEKAGANWRAKIGIVLQQPGAFEEVTITELLNQVAAYYPHPRPVSETIAAVGLTPQAETRLAKLSGGQRRRVDVALGIIGDPQVLFLDEPTTGFDPEARREFWDLIRSLTAEGTTILLTTHYLDEAEHLSDRAIVIAQGTLIADCPLPELGGPEARTPLVRWQDDNGSHEVRTEDPGQVVYDLHGSRQYRDLEVIRPGLEDIYLSLLRAANGSDVTDVASSQEAS